MQLVALLTDSNLPWTGTSVHQRSVGVYTAGKVTRLSSLPVNIANRDDNRERSAKVIFSGFDQDQVERQTKTF